MSRLHTSVLKLTAGVVAALATLSCSDPGSPVNRDLAPSGAAPASIMASPPNPVRAELTVCKYGSNANFTMLVSGLPAGGFSLLDGECALVYSNTGTAVPVTVAETPDSSFVHDSTVGYRIIGALSDTTPRVDTLLITSGNSVTVRIGLEYGAVLAFYNTLVPPQPASLGDFVWNDLNRNGIQDSGEPGIAGVPVKLYDCSNNLLASTTTNATGNYLFGGIAAGCYVVGFTAPSGFVFSPAGQGGTPSLDSDANTITGLTPQITVAAGSNDLTWDAGLNVPPAGLGDFVWNDLNANGIQDSGEPGIPGVTVTLAGPSGPQSTTTNGSGFYSFTNLAPGSYTVTVTPPAGFNASPINASGSTPANDNNGSPATVVLAAGANDLTIDFGYYQPGSIGDFVWNDTNQNGIQDAGEPGIAGVTVTLTGPGGTQTTTTNANGGYLFTNLVPGSYTVTVSTPSGFTPSPVNAPGSNTGNDSNGSPATVSLGAGANDLSIDFGYYQPVVNACTNGPIGGINLGVLPNYLFLFANGSQDANWQGATKGFAGDVVVDGILAKERTSGGVPYAGTIFTNDGTLSSWQAIVNQNAGQAFGSTGQTALVSSLKSSLTAAFAQINALPVTAGYASRSATSLNGVNTQNGISETIVVNVTSGFQVSSQIKITGDAGDVFVLRWDTDANFANGYQGIVKFQSGGAIVPQGGLKPGNFIHVAGDINASGGGGTPAAPYPQGPRLNNGTGALISGGSNYSGGGFFTGYWLTTGDPANGTTQPLSNGVFVGGWYTTTTKFSMTSGTSGVHVCPK
jgi:hypothetical protein